MKQGAGVVDDSRVSPVRCRAPGWDRVLKSPVNLTSTGCDTGGLGPSQVRVTNPIELYVLSRLTITRVLRIFYQYDLARDYLRSPSRSMRSL